MDKPSISWNTPNEIVVAEMRELRKRMLQMTAITAPICAVIAAISFFACHKYLPEDPKYAYFLVLAVMIAGLIPLIMVVPSTYCARGKMTLSYSGIMWSRIDAWRFADDSNYPNVRRIEFHLRTKKKRWFTYHFDPSEVSETDIRAVLDYYLPGKESDEKA